MAVSGKDVDAQKCPKILITTSRGPSSRLLQFVKELKLVLPNSKRMNRGNSVIEEIVSSCESNDISDLVIAHEHRGVPDGLIISHLPHGPTSYYSLSGVLLRHDNTGIFKKTHISEAYPHLVFSGFEKTLGKRVSGMLKGLFPVPKPDSRRVLAFSNINDTIILRHFTFDKAGQECELTEQGPRMELRLYQIKTGPINADHSDDEWVLRPHMNTARKRMFF